MTTMIVSTAPDLLVELDRLGVRAALKGGRISLQPASLIPPDLLAVSLLRDESLSPPERVRRYRQATSGSQASFYRVTKEIKQAQGLGTGERNAENLRKQKAETPVPPSVSIGKDDDSQAPLSNSQDSAASSSLPAQAS